MIIVLAFTGSLSVAEAGGEDIRAMLVGALEPALTDSKGAVLYCAAAASLRLTAK